MTYNVIRINKDKKKEEKNFENYRDALCYATNYRKTKSSKVYKQGQFVQKFNY